MSHYIGIMLLAVGGLVDVVTLPAEYLGLLDHRNMSSVPRANRQN